MPAKPEYRRLPRQPRNVVRVVAALPTQVVAAVDSWGAPAGLPSRTAAIAELLSRGLASVAEDQRKAG